jgi:hypothetical protein
MTEHLIKEDLKIDKTVTKQGSGNGYSWELHALPEYLESDTLLSEQVINETALLLEEKGIKDISIDLSEGYDEEELGKEHYRLKVNFGEGNSNEKTSFSKHYTADTGEEMIGGLVKSKVATASDSLELHRELEEKVADIYIKRMEETYPEWKNQWEEGKFWDSERTF